MSKKKKELEARIDRVSKSCCGVCDYQVCKIYKQCADIYKILEEETNIDLTRYLDYILRSEEVATLLFEAVIKGK